MRADYVPPVYSFVFEPKNKLKQRAEKSDSPKKYLEENKGVIYLYVYFPGTSSRKKTKRYISTGIKVLTKYWDKNSGSVKSSKNVDYQNLREQLNNFQQKYIDYQREVLNRTGDYSVDDIDSIKNYKLDSSSCFIKFYNKELELRKSNPITNIKNTIDNLKRTKKALENCYSTLPFDKIDRIFIAKIETYIDTKKYSDWTRWEIHKNIKAILEIAHKQKVVSRDINPYIEYKVSKPKKIPKFLTYQEYKRIENFESDNFKLQRTRDMFVFSFYAALRISDLLKVESKHIVKDDNNRVWLDLKAKKTGKVSRIPLSASKILKDDSPEAVRIANKYIELYKSIDNKKLFQISSVKYNENLKDLAKAVKIELNLTSHIARKSFGHIASKHFGIDISIVKEVMQHSSIETTMQYNGYNEEIIYEMMNKAFVN